MVARRRIVRNYGRNNNSPATAKTGAKVGAEVYRIVYRMVTHHLTVTHVLSLGNCPASEKRGSLVARTKAPSHSEPVFDGPGVVELWNERGIFLRRFGGTMILCDLCGKTKYCLQKEMRARNMTYALNVGLLWHSRLKGKGRAKNRETVFLPPLRQTKEREDEAPEPLPGEPPKIWGTH